MSDYSVLLAALAQLPPAPGTDNGSGPPPRLPGHLADRLAGQVRGGPQPAGHDGGRPGRRRLGLRAALAQPH